MTVHDDDDSFDLNFMRTLAPAYYVEPDEEPDERATVAA